MKSTSFQRVFTLFYILTPLTVAVRFALAFALIDPETGFYLHSGLGLAAQWGFNLLLLAAAAALFWLCQVKLPSGELELPALSKTTGLFLILAGLICEISSLFLSVKEITAVLEGYGLLLRSALPAFFNCIAGLMLLYAGVLILTGRQRRVGLFASVFIVIWMAVLLVSTFLSYPIPFHVSDNMLHILALCCMAFFMVAFFKALLGVNLRQSVRKAVSFGLLAAYFGAVLALPRLVQIWTSRLNMAVPAAGQDDLFLLLALAVFAYTAARSAAGVKAAPPDQPFDAFKPGTEV